MKHSTNVERGRHGRTNPYRVVRTAWNLLLGALVALFVLLSLYVVHAALWSQAGAWSLLLVPGCALVILSIVFFLNLISDLARWFRGKESQWDRGRGK